MTKNISKTEFDKFISMKFSSPHLFVIKSNEHGKPLFLYYIENGDTFMNEPIDLHVGTYHPGNKDGWYFDRESGSTVAKNIDGTSR